MSELSESSAGVISEPLSWVNGPPTRLLSGAVYVGKVQSLGVQVRQEFLIGDHEGAASSVTPEANTALAHREAPGVRGCVWFMSLRLATQGLSLLS